MERTDINHTEPLVSVITVCLNSESTLEETILSVISQTYGNIEYIIVDGGSTDGTLDIIKKYEAKISKWISEPDEGIYDAMNKAVGMTTGTWINFMNSGDRFYSKDSIQEAFLDLSNDIDLIYGSCEVRYESFAGIRPIDPISDLWKGVMCCHQSLFCKTTLIKKYPFNTSYKLVADYNFICQVYKDKCKFLQLDQAISSISAGGVSDAKRVLLRKEFLLCSKRNSMAPSIKLYLYYWNIILIEVIKILLKNILPTRLTANIQEMKYANRATN